MKRIMMKTMILGVALSLCLTLCAPCAAKEFIKNGSFDKGSEGWTVSRAAELVREEGRGSVAKLGPGKRSKDGQQDWDGWVFFKQKIEGIKPNTTYVFYCRFKVEQGDPSAWFAAQVALMKFKPAKGKFYFYQRATGSWQEWMHVITSASDCPDTIWLTLLNEATSHTFYFDDVSFFSRDTVRAKVVKKVTHPGKKLVRNGSFDEGKKGWMLSKAADLDANSFKGSGAKLGPAPKKGQWVFFKQEIDGIQPDTAYTFRCRVKADQSAHAQVALGKFKPVKGKSYFYKSANETWQEWTHVITSASDCPSTVELTLLNEGTPKTFYFDDVSFVPERRQELVELKVEMKKVPEVGKQGQNLISNWDFEMVEKGKAAGWFQKDRGVMAITADAKYFTDPSKPQGTCTIRSPGFQSDHAMAISVKTMKAPVELNTQVHNIKPMTPYTISFWYRMPANDRLSVFLFGKELRVHRTYKYNSMHWGRFSEIVNSGPFSGDVNLGFAVDMATSKHDVWLDKVELYEGTSPIGKNVARLWYQYYDYSYVSPDMAALLPFKFEWTFDNDKRPEEIRYVVEFPAEIEPVSCSLTQPWSADFSSKVKKTPITIDGKPYIRCVAHVKSGAGSGLRQHCVVPVMDKGKKKRDFWIWSAGGGYCGWTTMCWYLKCKTNVAVGPVYYYAEWDGGRQPKEKLNLKVTRVPEAGQPKRLHLAAGLQHRGGDMHPQLGRDFLRIGLSGIDGCYPFPHVFKDGIEGMKAKIAECRGLGVRSFSTWMNHPMYGQRRGPRDKDTLAMDLTGKRTGKTNKRSNAVCMEYRGPEWATTMAKLKTWLDAGMNYFEFDDAKPCVCYCPKCKASFREFLKEHTKLEYVDPSVFMKKDWKGKAEYKTLWNDFQLWHYGKCAAAMKKELVEHAKAKGLDPGIRFTISSWVVGATKLKHPFAASSLSVFDFNQQQTYINWSTSWLEGSPKRVGDVLHQIQKDLGEYAIPLAPTLAPGLTYMHPVCCLDPHAQMKYQILEAMMVPKFGGYTMYAGQDTDLGDMKYMGEANAIMIRFEDLVMDGEALEPITIREGLSGVRIKKKGNEALVLVSDYSTYKPKETVVKFSTKELGGRALVDVETNEKIAPNGNEYTVKIKKERARVFHVK